VAAVATPPIGTHYSHNQKQQHHLHSQKKSQAQGNSTEIAPKQTATQPNAQQRKAPTRTTTRQAVHRKHTPVSKLKKLDPKTRTMQPKQAYMH
jgi:hypothetical protein